MRADRLINIMVLLQNRGKMTTKELAGELEVSDRTIIRDMDALSTVGIPVVAERGKWGGWRLLDNFRSKLSTITLEEMKALFVFPSKGLLQDLGLTHSIDPRHNLLVSLPVHYQADAQAMWDRIHIDVSTWRQSKEKVTAFETIQQAVLGNKKLKIHYEKADGNKEDRLIEPLGLVAKGNRWYLVASRNGELRNYRASRIHSAKMEMERFERPANFHLATYWEQSKDNFIRNLPAYDVDVEIAPSIIKRITFTGKFVQVIEKKSANEQGWLPAVLRFNDRQEAIEYILGFGDQIKIVSPAHLTDEIVSLARRAIRFHQNR
ncbi:Predicted DNA-binding transcriptional regulator YafY, contains an HTH and WYL domains [Gracilibacillus orientalis]|uniref:Predicted DNA-binding transcriptional regulator YafY, contains an HTH and WYL domains n=1 Tax=Gracilibacillus orientalis TaxID=334253 RepID=A0A1I4LLK8_9BACI|nr:YafY family protein [Gracilibacillus orientalis]SFL91850.1 Predicted DNA-binding transcriptional regulator YafY, contains an HTH and WYL domains [Gracilibacillus orientalis]